MNQFDVIKKQSMKLLFNKVFLFLTLMLLLVAAYLPKLLTYQLSGDDLFLTVGAPRSWSTVAAKFTDFSGQYRPMTHSLFYFYQQMLPNTQLIWTVNTLLMLTVAGLFFANLLRFKNPLMAMAISLMTFLSPIFYYHFFSIAALNNTLILIFLLVAMLVVKFPQKYAQELKLSKSGRIAIASVCLVLAMLSKENFLVNGWVLLIVLWQNLSRKDFLKSVVAGGIFVGSYFFLHFSQYHSTGDYALGNSIGNALKMFLDFGSWLAGYPRGWQYGAADPKTILTYLTSGITVLAFATIVLPLKTVFMKWKMHMLFAVALALSLLPSFIISRSLVFYTDVALLTLVLWFATNQASQVTKLTIVAITAFVLGQGMQFYLYYPQWHTYSFVANANESAQNYKKALQENNFSEYDGICVTNNHRGGWGTKDGEAAAILYGFKGEIVNEKEDIIPARCLEENFLILRNDGWKYFPVTTMPDSG